MTGSSAAGGRESGGPRRGPLLPTLLVVALVAGASALFLARLGIDNGIGIWVRDDPAVAAPLARLTERFGSDRFLLVSLMGDGALAARGLGAAGALARRVAALPGVDAAALRGPGVTWRAREPDPDADALRRELLASPFDRGLLVARDGRGTGLWIPVRDGLDPASRAELVHGVVDAAREVAAGAGLEAAVVGPPRLNVALDEGSSRDAARLFPVAFGLSVLLLLAFLRCVRRTLAVALCGGLTVAATLGVLGAAGRDLNMVTAALPTVVWVIALAHGVHVLHALSEPRAGALAGVRGPLTWAALTTAAGFLALNTSSLAPVRDLGTFAALGTVLGWIAALLLLPRLVAILGPGARAPGLPLRVPLPRDRRGARALLVAAFLVLAGGLAAARGVRRGDDVLAFLPSGDPAVRDYREPGRTLGPLASIELDLTLARPGPDLAAVRALDALARALEARPGVVRALGPSDLLRRARQLARGGAPEEYALPGTAKELRGLLAGLRLVAGPDLARHLDAGGRHARISVLVDVVGNEAIRGLAGAARALAAAHTEPLGIGTEVTGTVPALVATQDRLVTQTLGSFGASFVAVLAVAAVVARSLLVLCAALLPILTPAVVTLGLMGLAGIPLDPGTMMVCSVAFGIGVDDTLHVLARWREARRAGLSGRRALATLDRGTGAAIVVTSVVNGLGFLALALASFVPIRHFGILTATALGAALLADLVVLPAGLLLADRDDVLSNPDPMP